MTFSVKDFEVSEERQRRIDSENAVYIALNRIAGDIANGHGFDYRQKVFDKEPKDLASKFELAGYEVTIKIFYKDKKDET